MLLDTHIHSHFSADSGESMARAAEVAVREGLGVICFTDHIDYDFPIPAHIFDFDANDYFAEVFQVREQFAGRLKVLAGVELGMQPHLSKRYNALLKRFPFDFALGSQHLVELHDPYYPDTFEGKDVEDVYRKYFEETLTNVKLFDGFDSLGHLDYITRYGDSEKPFPSYDKFGDVIDEILRILIERGKALEVNTAGYRKALGQPNPSPEILRRYRELGGELVTIGADAHQAEIVGTYCREAMELLRSLGFKAAAYYEKHRPVMVDL